VNLPLLVLEEDPILPPSDILDASPLLLLMPALLLLLLLALDERGAFRRLFSLDILYNDTWARYTVDDSRQ
jgi:hypothetical protein